MRSITLYSLPNCVQCGATKKWLDRAGVEYATVMLNESPDDAAAIAELGYKQAPIVIVSNGDAETDIHWGGFNPDFLKKYCMEIAA